MIRQYLAGALLLAGTSGCATVARNNSCTSDCKLTAKSVNLEIAYLMSGGPSVQVIPGMRLVFRQTPLLPRQHNLAVPPIAQYVWTRPFPERLTQADVFFASYLLSVSVRDKTDPESKLKQIADAIPNSNEFFAALSREAYEPLFHSLRVQFVNTPGGEKGQAQTIRNQFCRGTHPDFYSADPGAQRIELTMANDTYTFEPRLDRFFTKDVQALRSGEMGIWAVPNSQPSTGRTMIDLEIPVRIANEHTERYVPICTTVQELQEMLGANVAGVYRSNSVATGTPSAHRVLWFSRHTPPRLGSYVQFSDRDRAEVVLAAHDRIELDAVPRRSRR